MVLVSMVTLIVAIALKLAIDSWERGEQEGEDVQLLSALPALMERQLRSMVKTDPFHELSEKPLPFCGRQNAVSFFTSYAPQGSPWQGLMRVTYIFEEEEKTLYLYEQVITKKEDLEEEFDPFSDIWDGSLSALSKVTGITEFHLIYSDQERQDPQNAETWKDTWKCISTNLPTGLGLKLRTEGLKPPKTRSWYFRLGGLRL